MFERLNIFIQFYPAPGAAFGGTMTARIVHKYLAHQPGGNSYKVLTVLGLIWALLCQTQISLMHQGRSLQGVARALALQVVMRQRTEFLVDQRNQGIERLLVSRFPLFQQLAYGLGQLRHVSLYINGRLPYTIALLPT